MKKVLSFVLAVVMVLSLSTVAFAATWTENFGGTGADDVKMGDAKTTALDAKVSANLGMYNGKGKASSLTLNIDTGDSVADDFAISYKIEKGKDVVKVTPNMASKKVEIAAIQDINYSLTKATEYKVVITIKAIGKGHKDYAEAKVTVSGTVSKLGFDATGTLIGDEDIVELQEATGTYAIDNTAAAATVVKSKDVDKDIKLTFAFGNDDAMWMEFSKLYNQGNVMLAYNNDADKAIVKANLDADLSFYNFVPAEFDYAGKLILEADEDKFIYEIVNGAPVASKFAWDEDEYAWVLKTNVLGSYVLSDKELVVASSEEVANPSTGASDMVNVAVAMAVVSIAAAGAVALKK